MPVIKVSTAVCIKDKAGMMTSLSKQVAKWLHKPEKYVMVILEPVDRMMFGGENTPAVYVEFKSIGLPVTLIEALSAQIGEFFEQHTGVPKDRMYIEFTDVPRTLWGWNGQTF